MQWCTPSSKTSTRMGRQPSRASRGSSSTSSYPRGSICHAARLAHVHALTWPHTRTVCCCPSRKRSAALPQRRRLSGEGSQPSATSSTRSRKPSRTMGSWSHHTRPARRRESNVAPRASRADGQAARGADGEPSRGSPVHQCPGGRVLSRRRPSGQRTPREWRGAARPAPRTARAQQPPTPSPEGPAANPPGAARRASPPSGSFSASNTVCRGACLAGCRWDALRRRDLPARRAEVWEDQAPAPERVRGEGG